ncbi:hypothetical protein E2C01_098859 [Portunus trituberculatus]|uniref:Uncharacterized protein n=1 Tax=Portunus trituberculatus TaxID=210409 RepID=A0A5B7K9A9_PORTR|nr:hypothetical protein [Portunus trituberculatus]
MLEIFVVVVVAVVMVMVVVVVLVVVLVVIVQERKFKLVNIHQKFESRLTPSVLGRILIVCFEYN